MVKSRFRRLFGRAKTWLFLYKNYRIQSNFCCRVNAPSNDRKVIVFVLAAYLPVLGFLYSTDELVYSLYIQGWSRSDGWQFSSQCQCLFFAKLMCWTSKMDGKPGNRLTKLFWNRKWLCSRYVFFEKCVQFEQANLMASQARNGLTKLF